MRKEGKLQVSGGWSNEVDDGFAGILNYVNEAYQSKDLQRAGETGGLA